jgi:hypothetical protein
VAERDASTYYWVETIQDKSSMDFAQ